MPLLVGGTGLYFRSLQQGLSRLPAADPAVRARLTAEAARLGWATLHRRLGQLDPPAAARISPNDPQRIQRALEVYELTGQPLSHLQGTRAPGPSGIKVVLAHADRERQRRDIETRFHAMMAQGFEQELERLYRRGDLHRELPAMRLVGYRQGWAWLAGELDRDQMIRKAIVATQQLAKRQVTWLRGEEDAAWFDAGDPAVPEKILKFLYRNATLK